jgi:hypothetical protein
MVTGRGDAASDAFDALCRGAGRAGIALDTVVKRMWLDELLERSISWSFHSEFKLSDDGPIE